MQNIGGGERLSQIWDYVVFGYAVYSGGKIGIAPFWVHT